MPCGKWVHNLIPAQQLLLLWLWTFSTGYCVAKDSFCDGVNDCPGGEDEHYCYGIQYPNSVARETNDYGEVMKQTFGLWHSKCYKKPTDPDKAEMLQLCETLGYKENTKVDVRIIKEAEDFSRPQPMKPVLNSAYTELSLNKKFRILLKPSQPVAKLVHWDSTDKDHCNRLEIRCESKGDWYNLFYIFIQLYLIEYLYIFDIFIYVNPSSIVESYFLSWYRFCHCDNFFAQINGYSYFFDDIVSLFGDFYKIKA